MADYVLFMARLEITEAEAVLRRYPARTKGPARAWADRSIRSALTPTNGTASAAAAEFLRRL